MKSYRVGVIGLGFGQAVTVPVFQAHGQTSVVAITSARPEKARDLVGQLGVSKAYGNWREMIEQENLDVVAIATPADVQVEILKYIQSLPKPPAVFAEKPLSVNLQQADELLAAWKQKRNIILVDFEFPEIPAWREFQRQTQNVLSSDSKVSVRWCMQNYANKHRLENWKTRMGQGGGVLHAFGSHVFYNLEAFFAPVSRLRSRLSKSADDPRDGLTIWSGEAVLTNGATVQIDVNSDNPSETMHSFELRNGNDVFKLFNPTSDYVSGFRVQHNGNEIPVAQSEIQSWQKPFIEMSDGRRFAVSFLIDKMIRILNGETVQDAPTIEHGHRVQKLIELAIESHQRDGEWINV